MDDVVSRITRGDVNRMRPLDEAIGKNIKFTARHTASLFFGFSFIQYGRCQKFSDYVMPPGACQHIIGPDSG